MESNSNKEELTNLFNYIKTNTTSSIISSNTLFIKNCSNEKNLFIASFDIGIKNLGFSITKLELCNNVGDVKLEGIDINIDFYDNINTLSELPLTSKNLKHKGGSNIKKDFTRKEIVKSLHQSLDKYKQKILNCAFVLIESQPNTINHDMSITSERIFSWLVFNNYQGDALFKKAINKSKIKFYKDGQNNLVVEKIEEVYKYQENKKKSIEYATLLFPKLHKIASDDICDSVLQSVYFIFKNKKLVLKYFK